MLCSAMTNMLWMFLWTKCVGVLMSFCVYVLDFCDMDINAPCLEQNCPIPFICDFSSMANVSKFLQGLKLLLV